ncbi:MAG: hypothetical protein DRN14_06465 [Thermoplasmata archaeon]|nr:MAG: hypothetical protein DRN14_06465 [Thermoplasmata archaeon]HDJ26690.1 hypothetical protein [Aciduliprofundum sp.]
MKMCMVKIRIRAPLWPTEDPRAVEEAIRNIFPDAVIRVGEGYVEGVSESLENLRELLRRERIRDAVREALRRCVRGDRIVFEFNKQAATVGRFSLGVGNVPLGDVEVEISGADPEEIIEYLTGKEKAKEKRSDYV